QRREALTLADAAVVLRARSPAAVDGPERSGLRPWLGWTIVAGQWAALRDRQGRTRLPPQPGPAARQLQPRRRRERQRAGVPPDQRRRVLGHGAQEQHRLRPVR